MDFEQLRIFLVLAEERTFLGAANRLATSRSRVRRKLDQLEADAGTALVSREQSGLVLTPAGLTLARRGRALLEDARQLISHVREVGEEPTGLLRIALPFAPTPPGWGEICDSLQRAHPRLGLEFIHAEVPDALLPGRAEIALGFAVEAPSGCRSLIVGEYPIRLVASDVYLQRRRAPGSLEELSNHRLAVWRGPAQGSEQLRLRDGRPLPISPVLVSDDPRTIQRAVSDGDVLGVLPAMPSLDDPSLKPLFTESIAGTATLRLSVPEVLSDLPRVARFLELSATLHPQPA